MIFPKNIIGFRWYVQKYSAIKIIGFPFDHTANIFGVIFTVFKSVQLSTVISLYGLYLIAWYSPM